MSNIDSKRTSKYKKDIAHETVLHAMNEALLPTEKQLVHNFSTPQYPIIFIIGAQRSGTTLLMQLISQLFDVSYPTNFIARYWNAPYIGATLYKNLSSQFDSKDLDLQSDLGYTKGLEGPHEFGYFWKRWFPWESWENKEYHKIDYTFLQKELAAWQSINHNPLIFKNLVQLDYHLEKLYLLFPKSFFIFLTRDLKFNIQSTYKSRIKMFGNPQEWFGVKPRKYKEIISLSPIEQITKQILMINKDIEEQLNKIPTSNIIRIKYEDLIKDYKKELKKITCKIKLKEKRNTKSIELISGNKISISSNEFEKILLAIKKYSDEIDS